MPAPAKAPLTAGQADNLVIKEVRTLGILFFQIFFSNNLSAADLSNILI